MLLDTFAKLDIPRDKLILVMNQIEKRDPIWAEQVSEKLHHPVLLEIPYDREAVKNSINRGQPLLLDPKTHPMVKPLLEQVGEVRERLLDSVEAE